jgi:hypothetical protein
MRIDLVQGSLVCQVLTPKTVELEAVDLILKGKCEAVSDSLTGEKIKAHLEKTKTQFGITLKRIFKGPETTELIIRIAATAPRNLPDSNAETRLTNFLRDAIGKSQIYNLRVRKIAISSNMIRG